MLQNYKVELRELDREDLAVYQPKTRQHQSALDELARNLNFVKSSVEKEELMSGGSSAAKNETDGKGAKELIEMAKKTQEQVRARVAGESCWRGKLMAHESSCATVVEQP